MQGDMRGINTRSERLVSTCKGLSAQDAGCSFGKKIVLRLTFCLSPAAAVLIAAAAGWQGAAAEGETRSLSFFHTHTGERTTVTFRRNGQYDEQALQQLNWFLRDWRVNEPAKMDPRLFDILWEVYRESGSREPINIISAYRSPQTNAALRHRSKAVSEHSQHMLGKAMDIRLPDVETGRLRAIAMKMQYGGVGYYPSSAFVHVDTGSVRAWPRMSQDQLARLFPDGKTLHLPSNGKPLAGYEQAKAEILARNSALATQASVSSGPSFGSLMASLFGRRSPAPPVHAEAASEKPTVMAYASPESLPAMQISAPLPPRRPQDLLISDESTPAPADQEQAETTASLPAQSTSPETVISLGFDEKAAVRALFDPRASLLDLGFSNKAEDELSTTHFTGPAVKPLPMLRQAGVDLRERG